MNISFNVFRLYQIFNLFSTIEGHWGLVISTAFLLAAVGLIESLMTLNLVDELTESRGSGNRECLAQGGANILNGLFGGMGGCAMIGQSIINVNSGGRGRLSGIVASVALLCFILFGAPLIEQIPIAALVGVMFMVVVGTFAWSSFRIIRKIPISDAVVLIVVSAVTVWQDLAIAVVVGVIISALVFAFVHFNFSNFFYYFVLGVVMGYVYYWGRNLLFPIIIHFINNALVVFGYLYAISNEVSEELNYSYTLMPYITLGLSLLIFYLNHKRNKHIIQ